MNLNMYNELPFFAFDAETGIHNRGEEAVGKNVASPHHPENMIVWYGVTVPNRYNEVRNVHYNPLKWSENEFKMTTSDRELAIAMDGGTLMVGHNIKFDLLHMLSDPCTKERLLNWLRDGGMIWDTMIVEYLLTGQQAQFMNLDKLSTQYGGHIKDDRLKKDYWEKGISTEHIPDTIIKPYLLGDLRNTANNFICQLSKINQMAPQRRDNFTQLLLSQMEALLATTMIEHNGIHFNVPGASADAIVMSEKHTKSEKYLKNQMAQWIEISNSRIGAPVVHTDDVNPGSIQQVSAVLAGGAFKYVRKMPVRDADGNPVKYKGGKTPGAVKMRNTDLIVHVQGMVQHKAHNLQKTDKGYTVDSSALKKLSRESYVKDNPVITAFLDELLNHRSLSKELKVSYIGLLELTWPTDSCIHGNFNHCATNTGRLSSSAPNQMNFSSKETKE